MKYNLNILRKNFDIDIKKKIILYCPTYRSYTQFNIAHKEGQERENLFGYKKMDFDRLFKILYQYDAVIFFKFHPFEEKKHLPKFCNKNLKYFYLLDQNTLNKLKIQLYDILNEVDILITDYSSVYFDFLLLNKPIIFNNYDMENYINTRGLIFEPYRFWMPGNIVCNSNDLLNEIECLLKGKDLYKEQREQVCKLIFNDYNFNASDKIYNFLAKIG